MSKEYTHTNDWQWERLETRMSVVPCRRSLHACAVWGSSMYVFGGYDGIDRVNDFHVLNFPTAQWDRVESRGVPPKPRDRHTAVVYGGAFYIFGGFDGKIRVNDFHAFKFDSQEWYQVVGVAGVPPSARHSHAAVVHKHSMYIFGGFDGDYKSDFHEFNFRTFSWQPVESTGNPPRPRYRVTCVVHEDWDKMYLFGGHDGSRHLNDTYVFDFMAKTWCEVQTDGPIPYPRDSHVAVMYENSMFIYGGSTGSAMDDFHQLQLDASGESGVWAPVVPRESCPHTPRAIPLAPPLPSYHFPLTAGSPMPPLAEESMHVVIAEQPSLPGYRFCHTAAVYEDAIYIFGGYDGSNRLNDLIRFRFGNLLAQNSAGVPPSTLHSDLKSYVGSSLLSDITFIVEGIPIPAHKILCLRCPFFRAMLTGEMMESRAGEIAIREISYSVFLMLLEFIYCDTLEIPLNSAMDLYRVIVLLTTCEHF